MTNSVAAGLSRVTIVTPRSRADLALPSAVPLAHLLPTVLAYAGPDLADKAGADGGWVLSRLDGQVLDGSRSAAQLAVRDGELLYLGPRTSARSEIVFDDVIDAVATATRRRGDRWRVSDTRRFSLILGSIAVLGGAAMMLFTGPPQLPVALAALGSAILLLFIATVTSRAIADSRAGVVIGLVALVYAGIGGLLLLGGDQPVSELGASHVLVAATALMLCALVATVGIADAGPLFLGAAVCAAGLELGAVLSLAFGVGAAASAAVVVSLAHSALPLLPMAAFRMARLPIPTLPTSPEEIRNDRETVNGARVLLAADRAHQFLTGALATVAVISAVGSVVLTRFGGLPGVLLSAALSLLMLLRARGFLGRSHRLPVLVSGTIGLGAVTTAGFTSASTVVQFSGLLGGVLLVAIISISYGIAGAGRKASPLAGRTLDIAETLLILSVVPLAAWVAGLYGWIRAILG